MAHFEIQRNIVRFEALLRDAALEPAKRRTVELLLAEEKQKLQGPRRTDEWGRAAVRSPDCHLDPDHGPVRFRR